MTPERPARGSTPPLLVVDGLSKAFQTHWALTDVSFTVTEGSLVGLVGPNGSGKSTLLNILVGLDRPTFGSIDVGGAAAGSAAAKRAVSFAPDELPLPELLTGREYLELVTALERRSPDRALVLAHLFGLDGHLDKLVGAYSHGMKRRLQFSLTLSSDAPLIVLDEPFSGLDLEAVVLLREALRWVVLNGRSVLLTIHDIVTAERECGEVVVLSAGCVVAAGRPADLVAQAGVATLEEVVLRSSGITDGVRATVAGIVEVLATP